MLHVRLRQHNTEGSPQAIGRLRATQNCPVLSEASESGDVRRAAAGEGKIGGSEEYEFHRQTGLVSRGQVRWLHTRVSRHITVAFICLFITSASNKSLKWNVEQIPNGWSGSGEYTYWRSNGANDAAEERSRISFRVVAPL